ncbi:MAG: hypothetical protein WAR79_09665 [Melioribacteraceae bacterium]
MKILKFTLIHFLLFLFFDLILFAQDSSKIIILNENIGTVLDFDEKEKYKLLPNFNDDFISAEFYLTPDSLYKCDLKLRKDNKIQDSTFLLSYNSLKNIAVKIQYEENMKIGKTDFDYANLKLKFSNNEIVPNIKPQKRDSTSQSKLVTNNHQQLQKTFSLPIKKLDLDYSKLIERKTRLGVSFGISINNNNYEGLNDIYKDLERGLNISSVDMDLSNSPLFQFSTCYIFQKHFVIDFQYKFNFFDNATSGINASYVNLSLGYLFPIMEKTNSYINIGYSAFDFKSRKYYNENVIDYGNLEYIDLDGNTKGLKLSIGLMKNITSFLNLDLSLTYNYLPKLELSDKHGYDIHSNHEISIESFEIGLNFYFINY